MERRRVVGSRRGSFQLDRCLHVIRKLHSGSRTWCYTVRSLVLHDGPLSALGVLQPDPRVRSAADAASAAAHPAAVAASALATAALASAGAASAVAASAVAAATARWLQQGNPRWALSRRRVNHRQRSQLPGVDE